MWQYFYTAKNSVENTTFYIIQGLRVCNNLGATVVVSILITLFTIFFHLFSVVIFFLIYGVEVFFKVRSKLNI